MFGTVRVLVSIMIDLKRTLPEIKNFLTLVKFQCRFLWTSYDRCERRFQKGENERRR